MSFSVSVMSLIHFHLCLIQSLLTLPKGHRGTETRCLRQHRPGNQVRVSSEVIPH